MTKIYWIKLLISQIARECFLKAVRLESKLSSHLQTTGTWAQGEPLYMSLMQSLAETRDYTWVAVNSMQHFLYWKGVDARSMFEEWLTMRLNSRKKDCTKRPSVHKCDVHKSISWPSFSCYPCLSSAAYWNLFVGQVAEGQVLPSLIPIQAHRSH